MTVGVEVPTPYHRLLRTTPRYRWWRPLLALVLFVVMGFIANLAVGVLVVIIGVMAGAIPAHSVQELQQSIRDLATLDAAKPIDLVLALASLAVLAPLVPLAYLIMGLRPTALIASVMARIRWRWLGWSVMLALGALLVSYILTFVLGFVVSGPSSGDAGGEATLPTPPGIYLFDLAIVIVLVPLQAAAEELVFRGMLVQLIGSWVKWAPLAFVIPQIGFTFAHTQYVSWGLASVAIFGLTAAWVTWRTGGLESSWAFHAVNNIVSFALLSSGAFGSTVNNDQGGTWLDPVIQLVTSAAFAFAVHRVAARSGLVTRRRRMLVPEEFLTAPIPIVEGYGAPPNPAPAPSAPAAARGAEIADPAPSAERPQPLDDSWNFTPPK